MTKTKRKGGIGITTYQEGKQSGMMPQTTPSIPRGPSPVMEEDPGRNPPESVELWKSSQLRLTESATMDTGNGPVTSPTKHGLVEQGSDHESDHDR